jgi:hypothetical protein
MSYTGKHGNTKRKTLERVAQMLKKQRHVKEESLKQEKI